MDATADRIRVAREAAMPAVQRGVAATVATVQMMVEAVKDALWMRREETALLNIHLLDLSVSLWQLRCINLAERVSDVRAQFMIDGDHGRAATALRGMVDDIVSVGVAS